MVAVNRVVEMLLKIQANQGVSSDGQPAEWPTFTPPLSLLCPWLLQSLELPERYCKDSPMLFKF